VFEPRFETRIISASTRIRIQNLLSSLSLTSVLSRVHYSKYFPGAMASYYGLCPVLPVPICAPDHRGATQAFPGVSHTFVPLGSRTLDTPWGDLIKYDPTL
jgi:hypothetical protein